jgi:S1-C subfamily serine protease
MKLLAASVLSAILASWLTINLLSPSTAFVVAQEATAGRPGESTSPAELANPLVARVFSREGLTPDETVNVAVYDAVNRSVVNITSKAARGERFLLMEMEVEGAGSGAVLDHQGHIVTNNHVVRDSKAISVTLYNGESYEGTVVGADALNDLAVVKIDAPVEELFPLTLGDSRSLRVGMRVFAIGNPFGLERTLTTGIISSLDRTLKIRDGWSIRSIIQTDAAINPGSSGGPLLDAHGRLIGINTAIATTTGQSAGVGFAIPVSLVRRVIPQLLTHGRVIRPDIGIVKVYQTDKGLLIAAMRSGSPAELAGLRGPRISRGRRGPFVVEKIDRTAADLIVGVDEVKIVTAEDFLSYIEEKRPGEKVTLTIIRDGKRERVPVELVVPPEPQP